jgi:Cu(I)/Ag(I) efflux system membrane fusion protein
MRIPIVVALVAAVAVVAGGTGLWLGRRSTDSGATGASPAGATGSGREVLYWYDPMYPQQKFGQPGKSPFMDMQLVPKYAGGDGDAGTVMIEPRLEQNLGVRTARARPGRVERTLRVTGVVAFDERNVSVVQARVDAIVERLHVRAPWTPVERGTPLLTLLAPGWTAAQEEYLALRRSGHDGVAALTAAARNRLLLLGMDEVAIRRIERSGRAETRIALVAPRDGVLAELAVREGASVSAGMPLARINGLDSVWIEAAIPERDAARVGAGTAAIATLAALPGRRFAGAVEALLPDVDPMTRTLTARVVLDNPDGALVPGMYPDLELTPTDGAPECVLVPTEAVIATGARHVVIVDEGKGRFRAQEVRVGTETGGMSEILDGIADGERVVLSGQFLIDSEASLNGALVRLERAEGDAPAPEPTP